MAKPPHDAGHGDGARLEHRAGGGRGRGGHQHASGAAPAATDTALAEVMSWRLDDLDLVAFMVSRRMSLP
jgi:hypothetical protein